MEVNIDLISYRILRTLDNAPHLVDWDVLGLNENGENFRDEHTNWSFEINPVDGGSQVTISSNINIPNGVVLNNPTLDGTFERYQGETTFHVDAEEVTAIIVAELALFHFGRFPPMIANLTNRKTEGRYTHSTVIFSLAKLLLSAEQQF